MICMNSARHALLTLTVCLLAISSPVHAIEPDFLMDTDPALQVPQPVRVADPAAKALWLQALDRPEIDMQRKAAETIARAHLYGIPGLEDAIPRLENNLTANTSHEVTRFASARALIALNSRASVEKLFSVSQSGGADLRQLVEPALAEWNYEPARKMWLDRLDSPDTRVRDLVLAIRCLGQVEEQHAIAPLFGIIQDLTRETALRLEAATAIGRIASQGLESKAEKWAQAPQSPTGTDQLIATRLLSRHTSNAAKTLFVRLAGNNVDAVATAALHRLNEIDSESAAVLAERSILRDSSQLKIESVTACLKHPTVERVALLTPLLADAHPQVRTLVCDGLWQLAQETQFNEQIRTAAMHVLDGERWQGQQQAAILLSYIGHQPAADRFIELLDSPRTEVRVTTAWALRKLASPDTVAFLIEKVRQKTEQRQTEAQSGLDDQVAHLIEALGVMQVTDAVPLLMQYVPKHPMMGSRSRGAAIWALGRIFEGKPDPEVEDALIGRLTDFDNKPPEIPLVQEMSAVAIARMKAVDQAPILNSIIRSISLPVRLGVAVRWAVKELTNEELPPPEPNPFREDNWFLRPVHN